MWWNAFSIFLLVSFATVIHAQAKWDPLHLFVVCKRGLLKPADQDRLQGAMKWFEQAVQVEKLAPDAWRVKNIKKEIPPYTGLLTITAPDKVFSIAHDSPELDKLWEYATPIFLDYDASKCAVKSRLALASPIPDTNDRRPFAIKMWYCPENTKVEVDVFDLFRHEVLHGLGYGGNFKNGAGTSENYDWVGEDGSAQKATRRFLKLEGDPEIQAIRDHFGCQDSSVQILAESDVTHTHLNEYIFGNEIMTPTTDKPAPFSYISAEILEKSFSGSKPWYKVNRDFIAAEAETYTYGKGLGCDFLLKSCWELFKAKQSSIKFMYPFCRGTILGTQGQFCYKNEQSSTVSIDCKQYGVNIDPNAITGEKSEEGIEKSPNSPDTYNRKEQRFCPMAFKDYNTFQTFDCPPSG